MHALFPVAISPKTSHTLVLPRWRSAFASLSLSLLLSGCGGSIVPHEKIKEPPYVPALAEHSVTPTQENNGVGLSTGFYADLMDDQAAASWHPKLKDAVNQAVRLGILRPQGFQENFDPDRAITYGEFRGWVIDYQKVLSAGQNDASKASPPLPQSEIDTPATVTPPAASAGESLDSPMNPDKLLIPPSDMGWQGHQLAENAFLTREALCALYAFLKQKNGKAAQLTPEAIEAMMPPGQAEHGDETLGQFKDYANISDWAKRYVALAYQEKLLQEVFRLNPSRLTVDEGLLPQKALTRGDAMVFLNWLYGKKAATINPKNLPRLEPGDPASALTPATGTSGQNRASSPKALPALKSLQTMQESGPNGTRNALRVSGPE
jgi:hypothetical protein